MSGFISLVGITVLIGAAFLSSANRSKINWRTAGFALLLQFSLGGIALYLPWGVSALQIVSATVSSVVDMQRLLCQRC